MTQNKSLKRRVRERMSKTGERYTAARRQVLDKAPIDPPTTEQSATTTTAPSRAEAPPAGAPAAGAPPADEPLHGKTDRTWPQWVAQLDEWGAGEKSHTEIARWLNRDLGVNGWWAQDITVRYEKHIGRRVLGQRGDTFSATATKTIGVPAAAARNAWTDESVRGQWLPDFPLRQRPNRAKVTARFDADIGRVVAAFDARGDSKVSVAVEHEKLPDADTAERMRAFWREHLAALKDLLEG